MLPPWLESVRKNLEKVIPPVSIYNKGVKEQDGMISGKQLPSDNKGNLKLIKMDKKKTEMGFTYTVSYLQKTMKVQLIRQKRTSRQEKETQGKTFTTFLLLHGIVCLIIVLWVEMQGNVHHCIIIIKYTQSFIMKKLHITRHSPAYWRVTFDNPPLNLIDPEVLHELQDLINQFEADSELKVVVFDSANPEFYIAHVDILRGGGRGPTDVGPTGLRILPDFMQCLSRFPVISIASIRGRARGIGAEFVEGLDIRFGSREKMILGQPEVGAALIPGTGGTVYLPLLVGRARALEIVAGSEDYDADTAERYGWINRAIPDAELDDFVDRFARRIASFEKKALIEAKRLVNRSSLLPDDAQSCCSGGNVYPHANMARNPFTH